MRRTQLYLDDDLWQALHAQARREKTTISELVRRAVRDRYVGDLERRREAMQAIVALWKDRQEIPDASEYVRELRGDDRIDRLHE